MASSRSLFDFEFLYPRFVPRFLRHFIDENEEDNMFQLSVRISVRLCICLMMLKKIKFDVLIRFLFVCLEGKDHL